MTKTHENGRQQAKPRVTLREGFLKKKCMNSRFKSWNKRFFSLDDVDTLLYKSKKLKGEKKFLLTHDTKIAVLHNQFIIKNSTFKLTLRSDTKDSRRVWVSNLNAVIAQLKLEKQNSKSVATKGKLNQVRQKAKQLKLAEEIPQTDIQVECNTMTHILENIEFELDVRYIPERVIGRGAYGIVIEVRDETSRTKVAVKKIPGIFHNSLDAKRILREMRLLRLLRHPNIAHVIDLMRPSPIDKDDLFNDVYLVMDIMDTDLQTIISSNQTLTISHICFLVFQLLKALVYLESANVVHRDLKPQNILVNGRCELRVCDFGLARAIKVDDSTIVEQPETEMTTYVVTRWYRAPELLLASGTYSSLIDVWSVGCIFAELLTRTPLFTGEDFLNQLDKIVFVLGTPNEDDLNFIGEGSPSRYVKEMTKRDPIDLEKHLLSKAVERARLLLPPEESNKVNETQFSSLITSEVISCLKNMIQFSPNKRSSAENTLKFSFFDEFSNYEVQKSDIKLDLNEIESIVLEAKQLRNAVRNEINFFRPKSYVINSQKLQKT